MSSWDCNRKNKKHENSFFSFIGNNPINNDISLCNIFINAKFAYCYNLYP